MAITLEQMRQYARDYFELDEEDLPSSLLDRWADEGFTRVYRHLKRWPHYQDDATITTAASTAAYSVAALDQIHSIYGPDGLLDWKEETEARRWYDTQGTEAAETVPTSWSVWGGEVHLWPTPDSEYTLEARGWRVPSAFSAAGAGASPDLPEDFHQLVLSWLMHRVYQHQDDLEGAQLERAEFDSMLDILTKHETQAPTAAPLQLGRNRRRANTLPSRQKYPWE